MGKYWVTGKEQAWIIKMVLVTLIPAMAITLAIDYIFEIDGAIAGVTVMMLCFAFGYVAQYLMPAPAR